MTSIFQIQVLKQNLILWLLLKTVSPFGQADVLICRHWCHFQTLQVERQCTNETYLKIRGVGDGDGVGDGVALKVNPLMPYIYIKIEI